MWRAPAMLEAMQAIARMSRAMWPGLLAQAEEPLFPRPSSLVVPRCPSKSLCYRCKEPWLWSQAAGIESLVLLQGRQSQQRDPQILDFPFFRGMVCCELMATSEAKRLPKTCFQCLLKHSLASDFDLRTAFPLGIRPQLGSLPSGVCHLGI